MISIRARDRDIHCTPLWPITSGSVGLQVKFSFDDEWDGLTKTVKFRNGETTGEVTLSTNECAVPSTVLATPGGDLWIGIYGSDANGKVAIPTIWGKAGHIHDGVTPVGE